MPLATQQQLDAAVEYHRRMIADGYRYAWSTGTWTAPPGPAAPAEAHEPDDFRDESDESFEGWLLALKLTSGRADPRSPQAQLRQVQNEQRALRLQERILRHDVARATASTFQRRVAQVQRTLGIDEDQHD